MKTLLTSVELFLIVTTVVLFVFGLFFFIRFLLIRKENQSLLFEKSELDLKLEEKMSLLNESLEKEKQLQIELAHKQESEKQALLKFEDEVKKNEKVVDQLKDSFELIAKDVVDKNSQNFYQTAKKLLDRESEQIQKEMSYNEKNIKNLISPLKDSLESYQKHIHELEKERERTFVTVEEELKKVIEGQINLSQTTLALKDALKKPHVRGRWGEIQLKNCVELAGMSEYADVEFQSTFSDSNNNRLIPDMIVKMPGGHVVVVDAKTPIEAFLESLDAQTEEERQNQMLRHGRHVKEHVKSLSLKSYSDQLKESADFTVMFLPNESFLYAALETQSDLVEYALQQKILIATPPTLVGLLKVIRYGWNEEKVAKNAEVIAEAGKELHARVVGFLEAYLNVGKSLKKASSEYEVGLMRINSRIVPQAKKIEKLGAKSRKELPNTGIEHLL